MIQVYLVEQASRAASADTERRNLDLWLDWWGERSVSEITPSTQLQFRDSLAARGLKPSGVDRVLSSGRAALNYAVSQEILESAPRIKLVETAQQRRSRPAMGRRLSAQEIATLFDAAGSRRVMAYLILACCTAGRPGAILDAGPRQYDPEHQLIDLNPPGRVQTRKNRPILPVCATLKPWLEMWRTANDPRDRYVWDETAEDGGPRDIDNAWRWLRKRAGVDGKVTPYSLRHTIARELRKARISSEEIDMWLGHLPPNSELAASVYAPWEPDYLRRSAEVIDTFLGQVSALAVRPITPDLLRHIDEMLPTPKAPKLGIGADRRERVRQLIVRRVPTQEIAAKVGCSVGTVSNIRREMRAGGQLGLER